MEGNLTDPVLLKDPLPLRDPIPLKDPLPPKVVILEGFQGLGHLLRLPQVWDLLAGAFLGNALRARADLGRSIVWPGAEVVAAQQGTDCTLHVSTSLPIYLACALMLCESLQACVNVQLHHTFVCNCITHSGFYHHGNFDTCARPLTLYLQRTGVQ